MAHAQNNAPAERAEPAPGRAQPSPLGTVGRRSDGGAKRGGSEEIRLLSRLIGIIITILIIVWIVSNPATAGNDVHGWIAGIFVFFHHVS